MKRVFYLLICLMLVATSCNNEEAITTVLPPEITLVAYEGQYTVKKGAKLTISPEYESADNAHFSWMLDGKEIGSDRYLIFSSEEVGEKIITLIVSNEAGSDKKDIRIEVVELEIPVISLPEADKGFLIASGTELQFTPSVKATSLAQTYTWWVDGTEVSSDLNYTFQSAVKGNHTLKFEAKTDDGSAFLEFTVKIVDPSEISFEWEFEKAVYNYATGRSIRIRPVSVSKTEGVTYQWKVDGKVVQESEKPEWICSLKEEKKYQLEVVATIKVNDQQFITSKDLEINVCAAEGTYKKAKNAGSKADFNEVYEYLAAPGQFINENYTATTMEAAIKVAKENMEKNSYVSLGGFGGSIVIGFDHSIENGASHDFGIYGNPFDNSSEPGIVWVMQDENGDGLPNDTWYELKGSETGKAETIQDYAVTYYRPEAPGMDVQWKDNQGKSGKIEYLQFHQQEFYYPAWVKANSYTLRGTCLKSRNHIDSDTGYWVQPSYDWGYVDNYSPNTDMLGKSSKLKANANIFDIDNAIDYAGKPVRLSYIDFVKVQNAVNAQSGWLGELSTEVFGFFDYSMMK